MGLPTLLQYSTTSPLYFAPHTFLSTICAPILLALTLCTSTFCSSILCVCVCLCVVLQNLYDKHSVKIFNFTYFITHGISNYLPVMVIIKDVEVYFQLIQDIRQSRSFCKAQN